MHLLNCFDGLSAVFSFEATDDNWLGVTFTLYSIVLIYGNLN